MRHAIAAVFLFLITTSAAAQATNPNQTALTEAREHAKAGRVNEAFAALERVAGPAPGVVNALKTSPDFEALRKDARYNALLEKLTPCSGAQYRQFDFWVGEWEVRGANNQLLGHNRISKRYGGCVVLEEWQPAGGGDGGSSFNFYDQNTKQWHQFWVDSSGTNWLSSDKQGNPMTMYGGIRDGAMVLVSHPDSLPSIGLTRATWRPLPDGRVRQTFESSTDNGKTWGVSFDGFYSKAKKP
ncbi:MAG TPA: hypothetical protein VKB93_25320 [Thermoanaerobaculia bacterium]|nr:hypothetical protein [Thermoanaerobaculia bacterium]